MGFAGGGCDAALNQTNLNGWFQGSDASQPNVDNLGPMYAGVLNAVQIGILNVLYKKVRSTFPQTANGKPRTVRQ